MWLEGWGMFSASASAFASVYASEYSLYLQWVVVLLVDSMASLFAMMGDWVIPKWQCLVILLICFLQSMQQQLQFLRRQGGILMAKHWCPYWHHLWLNGVLRACWELHRMRKWQLRAHQSPNCLLSFLDGERKQQQQASLLDHAPICVHNPSYWVMIFQSSHREQGLGVIQPLNHQSLGFSQGWSLIFYPDRCQLLPCSQCSQLLESWEKKE